MKSAARSVGQKHCNPQVVRANGLQVWSVLGLLSGMVGLLRSCVDYQKVIVFRQVCISRTESMFLIDSLFWALLPYTVQ
jgi:hypothetical protein